MENYTEKKLKPMNKAQLIEIAVANGIDVPEGTKNDDIIALIVAKGCPMPEGAQNNSDENNGNGSGGNPPPDEPKEDESVPKFSKEQLLNSNWYSHRRDVLAALLEDGKMYSHAAVDKLIGEFMKGKVK